MDALDAEMVALQKFQAAKEQDAKKTVKQILEENAQRREEAREGIKDFKRAEELENRAKRGARLSEKDQEWLDAFNAPFKAQVEANKAAAALKKLQEMKEKALLDAVKGVENEMNLTRLKLIEILQRG